MTRINWDRYFLQIAEAVAQRATCDRARVGAILTRNKLLLSTGYNGSPRGLPHCDDVGHQIVDGHCVRTVHAEANAIIHAAARGIRTEGATIFVTHLPCRECCKLIINAGIAAVVFGGRYGPDDTTTLLREAGLQVRGAPVDNMIHRKG